MGPVSYTHLDVYKRQPLEGVEKIKEGVGRAVEMGRPVHWSYGTGAFDAQHMAAFSLLSYTAKLCAEYDCRLIVSIALPELAPMTQEIINKAYSCLLYTSLFAVSLPPFL